MDPLSVIGILVLVFHILWFLFSSAVFFLFFWRRDDPAFDQIDLHGTHYEPYIPTIQTAIARMRKEPKERLTIKGRRNTTLVADYYRRGSDRTIIFVHGLRANPYNNFAVLGCYLLDKGYNLLCITQRSHGDSGGRLIGMGLREWRDVLDWIDVAAQDPAVAHIAVYGTSMGGATVAYMSDRITEPKVKMLTVDCSYRFLPGQLMTLMDTPAKKLMVLCFPVFELWGLLLMGVNLCATTSAHISRSQLPICFLYGEADSWIPYDHVRRNYDACPNDKLLITIPDAGHTAAMLAGGQATMDEFFHFMEKYMK